MSGLRKSAEATSSRLRMGTDAPGKTRKPSSRVQRLVTSKGALHCHRCGQALQVLAARDFDGAQRFCGRRDYLDVKQEETAPPWNLVLFFDYLLQLARIMTQVINHALPFPRLKCGLSPIIY